MDRIYVYQSGNDRLAEILNGHRVEIGGEVLADEIRIGLEGGYKKEWNINGEKTTLGVEKINM